MQETLFAQSVSCWRCGATLHYDAIAEEEPFWCKSCDTILEKTLWKFDRPIGPATLWNHGGWYRLNEMDDAILIKCYQYAKFTNVLCRYWDLQYYPWSQDQKCALSQSGGPDRIESLAGELTRRGLMVDAENYHIDFPAIKRWIANAPKRPQQRKRR